MPSYSFSRSRCCSTPLLPSPPPLSRPALNQRSKLSDFSAAHPFGHSDSPHKHDKTPFAVFKESCPPTTSQTTKKRPSTKKQHPLRAPHRVSQRNSHEMGGAAATISTRRRRGDLQTDMRHSKGGKVMGGLGVAITTKRGKLLPEQGELEWE